MARRTFSIGGVHPNDAKISRGCAIEALPLPQTVYISLAQHIGAPAMGREGRSAESHESLSRADSCPRSSIPPFPEP